MQDFNETKMEDSGVTDGDVEMKSDHSLVPDDGEPPKIPLEHWRIWDFFRWLNHEQWLQNSLNRLERNGVATTTHIISPIR